MKSNKNSINIDNILINALKKRKPSRKPLTSNEFIEIAMGKKPVPKAMDKGEQEILEVLTQIIKETEQKYLSEKQLPKLQVLIFSIKDEIQSILSSFSISPLNFATVRGESDPVEGYHGKTEDGTSISILNSANGEHILSLSWEDSTQDSTPSRALIKHDGKLIESLPVEENSVEFSIPKPGIYYIETIEKKKISNQFSVTLLD